MTKVDVFKRDTTSLSGKKVARLMGQKVVVSLEMIRRFDFSTKKKMWKSEPLCEPRTGWIVGARRVFDGKVRSIGWDEGNEFIPTKSTPVILVAYWPMERPVHVYPDEDSVCLWGEGDPEPFSSSFGVTHSMRENSMKEVRKQIKQGWYPRDEKGRFRALTKEEYRNLAKI